MKFISLLILGFFVEWMTLWDLAVFRVCNVPSHQHVCINLIKHYAPPSICHFVIPGWQEDRGIRRRVCQLCSWPCANFKRSSLSIKHHRGRRGKQAFNEQSNPSHSLAPGAPHKAICSALLNPWADGPHNRAEVKLQHWACLWESCPHGKHPY